MTSQINIEVQILPNAQGLPLPSYQSADAAGLDLLAAIQHDVPIKLMPRHRVLVPTGFIIAVPPGYEAQVRPRSGLAFKHGVTVLNAPGTIDADYRGEVCVLLINHGEEPFTVSRGERVAQLVIAPVTRANLTVAATLSSTVRGSGGFGSTGR
jgi:dUTP pyrophosphatase